MRKICRLQILEDELQSIQMVSGIEGAEFLEPGCAQMPTIAGSKLFRAGKMWKTYSLFPFCFDIIRYSSSWHLTTGLSEKDNWP